jgi:hypothetical protein
MTLQHASILYRQHTTNDSLFDTVMMPTSPAPQPSRLVDSPKQPTRLVEAHLPFTIGVVSTEEQLRKVQALRAAAYGHHLPGLAASFSRPDPLDLEPEITLFYVEDKQSGELVGSARIQVNRHQPLQIERSLELPPELAGRLLSEITRLTVLPGYPHPVRMTLVKACQVYCIAMQIVGVLAGSRRSLLRQYKSLGFRDVFEDERLVPLAHGAGLEHRILFRDTVNAEAESRANNQPYYDFMFRTYHPDIRIFESVGGRLAAVAKNLYDVRAA